MKPRAGTAASTVFAKQQHTATRDAKHAAYNQLADEIGWDKMMAMDDAEVEAAVAKLTMQPGADPALTDV